MSIEWWRPVVGFSGNYLVSSAGRVRSVQRVIIRGDNKSQFVPRRILTPSPLKPHHAARGYLTVTLCPGNKRHLLHRLVAQAFVLNPLNKPFVHHKDDNPLNCKADNLEWVTALENTRYSIAAGRHPWGTGRWSKISKEDRLAIREAYTAGMPRSKLAAQYHVSRGTIWNILWSYEH